MTAGLIAIIAVSVLAIYLIAIYNRLVSYKNRRENAFADIDVQLKQRHDLVPQLVSAVKGYMEHEAGVLKDVTEARARAQGAGSIDERIEAEQQLTSAIRGFQIQVEAYPDLKASTNFMQLQEEIADIENKLSSVRRFFNSATRELNVAIQKFPNNLVAGVFGFTTQKMFDLGPDRASHQKAPEIKF
ncbi:MAG: LemA family protein [Bacteroidetes bacterium]|jgi:LemA protein|nr:LemA family protein [Bacteroidota bacterium]